MHPPEFEQKLRLNVLVQSLLPNLIKPGSSKFYTNLFIKKLLDKEKKIAIWSKEDTYEDNNAEVDDKVDGSSVQTWECEKMPIQVIFCKKSLMTSSNSTRPGTVQSINLAVFESTEIRRNRRSIY